VQLLIHVEGDKRHHRHRNEQSRWHVHVQPATARPADRGPERERDGGEDKHGAGWVVAHRVAKMAAQRPVHRSGAAAERVHHTEVMQRAMDVEMWHAQYRQ
jgi:hypothetical protein